LIEAQRKGGDAARKAGKPFMLSLSPVGLDRTMPLALKDGYTMFMISADISLFTEGVRALVDTADRAVQATIASRDSSERSVAGNSR
jgi:hypothetical protein